MLRSSGVAFGKFFLAGLLVVAFLGAAVDETLSPFIGTFENTKAQAEEAGELRRVARVIDGDTIVLSPNEKVRLIGVDTPESVHPRKPVKCFGKAAREFIRRAVEGKNVRIEFDSANMLRQHKDRYGRTLVYLYTEDGSLLNAELIQRGYAHAYTRFAFRYIVEFREMERQARSRNVGLWSNCGG